MKEIKVNKSIPVVQPPDTYDLLGLSHLELKVITNLLGASVPLELIHRTETHPCVPKERKFSEEERKQLINDCCIGVMFNQLANMIERKSV